MMHQGRLRPGTWKVWTTFLCLVLVLTFTALESTHSHPDASASGRSGSCAVCISVHANAPALTVHTFQVLLSIERVADPLLVRGNAAAAIISLFIRPPPAA